MTEKHIFISKRQAQILVRYAGEESNNPLTQHLYCLNGFAWWTNRFIALRWDLRGGEVKDGQWIDLVPPETDAIPNQKFTIDGNLAAWAKMATVHSSWDLMDPERWRSGVCRPQPDLRRLFVLPKGTPQVEEVAFDPSRILDMGEMVREGRNDPLCLLPSKSDDAAHSPWWLTGGNPYAAALITPERFPSGADGKPYTEDPESQKDTDRSES